MGRVSLFIFLILTYLAVTKEFPTERVNSLYAHDEVSFSVLFKERPISVILEDKFQTGLFIKTYYMKLRAVKGLGLLEALTVRTPYEFWARNDNNIGMSIFRISGEKNAPHETTPLPPGLLFINNPTYGTWKRDRSGREEWEFHRSYKYLPQVFGWQSFRPTKKFYESALIHRSKNQSYYGPKDEFRKGERP